MISQRRSSVRRSPTPRTRPPASESEQAGVRGLL